MSQTAEEIVAETTALLAESEKPGGGGGSADDDEIVTQRDDDAPTGDQFDQMDDEAAEAEAAVHGWKPEDEYTGPKGRWRDAREFLRRGEQIDHGLKAKVRALEAQQKQLISTTSALLKDKSAQYEKEKAALIEQLEAARAEALEGGDGKEFSKLDKKIRKLEAEPAQTEAEVNIAVERAQADFEARNDWLEDDEMDALAKGLGNKLFLEQKFDDPTDFFKELELRVKKTASYKAKYGKPARRASSVETGGRAPSGRKAPHTYEGMPKEYRVTCDMLIEQSSGVITREDYAKNYWANNPEG